VFPFLPESRSRLSLRAALTRRRKTIAILDPAAKKLGITINQTAFRCLAGDQIAGRQRQAELGRGRRSQRLLPARRRAGLVEKLDFAKLPNGAAMPAEYRSAYSVAYEFYSSVLAYSQKKFTAEARPTVGPTSGT